MDPWAMREGELLLGNPPGTAALEMAGYGGQFRIRNDACQCALTGAPMQARLDGICIPWHSSFRLQPGQSLDLGSVLTGQPCSGTYGYLHLAGGLDTTVEIGARSTHLRAGVGGLDGKPLQPPAELPIGYAASAETTSCILPAPAYLTHRIIRIVWGPHAERFSQRTRQRLLSESFAVSPRRDRMAMQLHLSNHEPFDSLLTGLSDPVMLGDIQVTGDGSPVILMREHQPTGGYPRIASVISADLSTVAQLPTGVPFRFSLVTQNEAIEALKSWQNELQALTGRKTPLTRSPPQAHDLMDYNLISGAISAYDP